MNERLKQLAIESKLIAPEYNGFDHTRLSISQQKFAELIVRECTGVCESMQLIGPYKEVQDATLKDASMQIKQHFGVES